ncbi:nucleotide-binding alpha-beta plait domain-containing protein [Tanacetum coccineum]
MLDGDWTEVSRMKYGSFIGSQRSKEDDVQKISTYVFVTNFPDQYGAKDLWNSCKTYGHVVDAYIPNRRSNADVGNNVNGAMGASNSYVHVVKGTQIPKEDTENDPSLVLDEPCLNQKDYSLCLMGKVKDFASLSNLKVVLVNEVKFVKDNEEENDLDDESYKGKLNVDGLKNTVGLEVDSDVEEIQETKFAEEPNKPTVEEGSIGQNNAQSEDPFGLYDLLNKKRDANNKDSIPCDSLKYPPGFTPRDDKDASVAGSYEKFVITRECVGQDDGLSGVKQAKLKNKLKNGVEESICSGQFQKSEVPRTGGSILQLIDDLVKVGQTMGYDMKGCMKNMEEIIESQGMNRANR